MKQQPFTEWTVFHLMGIFFIVYGIYLQVIEFMCTSFNCFKLFQYLPDPSSR